MLYRWIPAAFPTPTRWQCRQKKWVTKCVVLPHLMARDGSPEQEWKFRKLYKIPSAKTLYPEKWSSPSAFTFFPFGKARICCGSWRTRSPMCHLVLYRQLSHSSKVIFLFAYSKNRKVCAIAGTGCIWHNLYGSIPVLFPHETCFQLHWIVYLSVSDPIPA